MTIYLHFICIFPAYTFEQFAFDLFFCFSNRGVCSHSLQAGEGVLWNCLYWGRPCYKSKACNCTSFIRTKSTVLDPPCMPSLPLPGCLGLSPAAGLQTELALWQGWSHPTPHSCRGKLCAPRSKQQLSGEFICSHMNSKSAFSISKLQRGFALWEMPKCEVCVSLLGMRYKMHNPSNKDMSETAQRILEYKQLCLQSQILYTADHVLDLCIPVKGPNFSSHK